jgi:hypothetical protein
VQQDHFAGEKEPAIFTAIQWGMYTSPISFPCIYGGPEMTKPPINTFNIALLTFISILLSIFCCHGSAIAFKNEPEDFRGIKWQTNIDELANLTMIAEDGSLKFFEKKNDKLKIGNASLDNIIYGFYKKKFYNVIIYYSLLNNFSMIKDVFVQTYGDPLQPNRYVEKYLWFGNQVDILLTYDDVLKKGRISYIFKPLMDEMEADDKLKASQGATDL